MREGGEKKLSRGDLTWEIVQWGLLMASHGKRLSWYCSLPALASDGSGEYEEGNCEW